MLSNHSFLVGVATSIGLGGALLLYNHTCVDSPTSPLNLTGYAQNKEHISCADIWDRGIIYLQADMVAETVHLRANYPECFKTPTKE